MLFKNKKAISPLVATILLVAFAVSIGALIMNWTSSSGSPNLNLPVSCSAVKLKVLSSCVDDTETVLSFQNNGPIDINSILLKDNSGSMINYRIPSSLIIRSEGQILRISKQDFNSTDFEVIPIVVSGVDEMVCTSKKADSLTLVNC